VSELNGIGRKMPWTMASFAIASLSMIGIPPLAGFSSKWYLALGSAEAGDFLILSFILIGSILNAAYFLPVVYKAFFEEGAAHEIKERPIVVIPLVLTAAGTLILGIYPDYLIELAKEVIR